MRCCLSVHPIAYLGLIALVAASGCCADMGFPATEVELLLQGSMAAAQPGSGTRAITLDAQATPSSSFFVAIARTFA